MTVSKPIARNAVMMIECRQFLKMMQLIFNIADAGVPPINTRPNTAKHISTGDMASSLVRGLCFHVFLLSVPTPSLNCIYL